MAEPAREPRSGLGNSAPGDPNWLGRTAPVSGHSHPIAETGRRATQPAAVVFGSSVPPGSAEAPSRLLKKGCRGSGLLEFLDDGHWGAAMRGEDANKGSLFSYIDLEKRVRADHPLGDLRDREHGAEIAVARLRGAVLAEGRGAVNSPARARRRSPDRALASR